MPIYWINTKNKGLSGAQVTEAEHIADGSSFAIAHYFPAQQAIHVAVLDNHVKGELPVLPYGLTYDDFLNA